MAGKKGKQQFQGAGRRFRGDIWLDQKVSGRTMAELQSRHQIPGWCECTADAGIQNRVQTSAQSVPSAARREDRGKKRSRKGSAGSSPAARSRRNCSIINRHTICMGTDLYKQDLGSIPPVSQLPARQSPDAHERLRTPSWERGVRGKNIPTRSYFARE